MKIDIVVIKGDGVGAEMTAPAVAVIQRVAEKCGHELQLNFVPACSETIDVGEGPLPEKSLEICLSVPAVLLGNTGLDRYKNLPPQERPEAALLKLRRAMGVTTNIRPVKYYPELSAFSPLKERVLREGLDLLFVRDIVGGILCSDRTLAQGDYGREAYEREYYNEKIIRDTAEIAFQTARLRGHKVTNLDKSNVLESSHLWRQTVNGVSHQYPDIELNHYYIDYAAMKIMESPGDFDVVLTSNLFGDIISDEGTQMSGTQYLYGSAEINKEGKGIYTPNQLHYPDESIIGKDSVNPLGMIAAAALMLRYTFRLEAEAKMIENAVRTVIRNGFSTRDIWEEGRILLSASEMGRAVEQAIVNFE